MEDISRSWESVGGVFEGIGAEGVDEECSKFSEAQVERVLWSTGHASPDSDAGFGAEWSTGHLDEDAVEAREAWSTGHLSAIVVRA